MLTKKTAIIEVQQFLNECRRLPITIDKAILFGSVINGKATELSDIDLALFSEKFSDDILKNLDLVGSVNIHFPNIDVHTYPTSRYKQEGLLMDQIIETGLEITV